MKKLKGYLLEFFVIFISITFAFISENWREQLQDEEDYALILDEIYTNLLSDSAEFSKDLEFIELQLHVIDRLLNTGNPPPVDSLDDYFDLLMYNYRWPDVKSTGIDQLRNSKNLNPDSDLITEVNNYYTWTEFLKESTPYQYIMPQNAFNEWIIQHELIPVSYRQGELDPKIMKQLHIRLEHLRKSKRLQRGVFQRGLNTIVQLLDMFHTSGK
jgi:hypothetical protein